MTDEKLERLILTISIFIGLTLGLLTYCRIEQKNIEFLNKKAISMISEKAHNFLNCTDCNKPLADVVVTGEADVEFNYVATCPYCNGESPVKKIKGLVHTGSVPGTIMSNRVVNNGKVVLQMKRENVN